jgi:succinylglutamate desuccinylase
MTELQELYELPDELLHMDATRLHRVLGGPTLIHLEGERQLPLFVSVLMHGNETTGWDAIRQVLLRYLPGGRKLPRSLSLFIGNTAAAEQGLRHLPEQPDYNRVWPGSETSGSDEHRVMEQVVASMAGTGVFASIDVHNNTGINPHYACVNVLEYQALHLAALFGRTVVYFIRPRGVASMAMAALGPSVTLECGKVGHELGTTHAVDYIDACLHMVEIPDHPVPQHDIQLFHTVAVVRVPPEVSFDFGDNGYTLDFSNDIDHLNFREVPVGTRLGNVNGTDVPPVDVRDEQDRLVTDRYFRVEQGALLTRSAVMPSMLTRDKMVIRQDCLCYLMERYDDHLLEPGTPAG